MRILIVTHYFPPEVGAPQARLSEFARFWHRDGHDVTVLTGMPNHPTGVIPPHYRRKLRAREDVDGYHVVRTWLYAAPNEGVIKKTLSHLSFMLSGGALGIGLTGSADVVIVSSPTFFSIFSAWFLAKVKRCRLVVEVRDLWPALLVELGVMTNSLAISILEHCELWAYRQADAVVVVSEGFRSDLICRGVPPEKVHTIRNGVDVERFGNGDNPRPARLRLAATNEEIVVLYLGTHGLSHGLDVVVAAAEKLQDRQIRFAFVGDGAMKGAVREQIARLALENITMLPSVPREEVPGLLAAADICLVPLRDLPLFSTFIPSKIFEYFASGKAVIGAVQGEAARILLEGGAVVVDPGDADALSGAITELADDSDRRAAMGRQGRTYVEQHFNRRDLAARYRELLSSATQRAKDPA